MPIPQLLARAVARAVVTHVASRGWGGAGGGGGGHVGAALGNARIDMTVSATGIREARASLTKLAQGTAAAGGASVLVGSGLRYSRYVHEGTRRMRGRPFLADALRRVEPRIASEIARALEQGPAAVDAALLKLGYEVEALAKAAAPVRTGTLRRSLHTVQRTRGGRR